MPKNKKQLAVKPHTPQAQDAEQEKKNEKQNCDYCACVFIVVKWTGHTKW